MNESSSRWVRRRRAYGATGAPVAGGEGKDERAGRTSKSRTILPSFMEKNVGGPDRIGRVVVSLALLAFGYRSRGRTIGTLAFLCGADLLATVVIRRCPVNALLGIDTCN